MHDLKDTIRFAGTNDTRITIYRRDVRVGLKPPTNIAETLKAAKNTFST